MKKKPDEDEDNIAAFFLLVRQVQDKDMIGMEIRLYIGNKMKLKSDARTKYLRKLYLLTRFKSALVKLIQRNKYCLK